LGDEPVTSGQTDLVFTRRMLFVAGAQTAVAGALIGRMGWLAIMENEKYNLLSEDNRVQLISYRRGAAGLSIATASPSPSTALTSGSISSRADDGSERELALLAQLLALGPGPGRPDPARDRCKPWLQARAGRENVPYDRYAAVRCDCPSFRDRAGARLYPLLSCRRRGGTSHRLCRSGKR
jgi:penicillin-binding protein 2